MPVNHITASLRSAWEAGKGEGREREGGKEGERESTTIRDLRLVASALAHRLKGGSSGLVPGAGYGPQLSSVGADGDGQGRYTALHSIRFRTWHTGYST